MPPRKAIYADDTAIYTSLRNENLLSRRLQCALDEILSWASRWRLRINSSKCVAVRFTRRLCPPSDDIFVGNFRLPWSQSVQYLGILLDQRLTFGPNTTRTIARFAPARSVVAPFLCRRSELSLKIKLLICITFLRPVLTYGALT